MSVFEMYLLMKLDIISDMVIGLSCVLLSVFGFLTIFGWIAHYGHSPETIFEKKTVPILTTIAATFFIFSLFVGKMIPTTQEAAVLYVAPKVINSEFSQETLPQEAKELYGLVKEYLEEQTSKEVK